MIALPFITPVPSTTNSPFSPQFFKVMMFGAALMYMLPAAWGIATSIGLFRLKEWARISMIVFSVLLILMTAFGGLMALVMPMPPTPNQADVPNVATAVRIVMAVFAGTLMSVGIWWLVFFTRPNVKEQFVPAQPLVMGATVETTQATPDFSVHAGVPRKVIARIELRHELTDANLQKLYDEVRNYRRLSKHKPTNSVFA